MALSNDGSSTQGSQDPGNWNQPWMSTSKSLAITEVLQEKSCLRVRIGPEKVGEYNENEYTHRGGIVGNIIFHLRWSPSVLLEVRCPRVRSFRVCVLIALFSGRVQAARAINPALEQRSSRAGNLVIYPKWKRRTPRIGKRQSRYTGVRYRDSHGGKWVTEILPPQEKNKVSLGEYETEREAAVAVSVAIFYFKKEVACYLDPPTDLPALPSGISQRHRNLLIRYSAKEAAENDREQVKKASQRGEGVAEEEVTDNSRVKRGRTNTSIAINRGEAVMTIGFQTADSDAIMTPFPSNQNCWQGLPEGNFEFEAECGSHSPAIILEVTTISPENQLFTSSDKLPQDLSHEGSEISNLSDKGSREFISARDNNSDFDDCGLTAESRLERPSVAGGFADFWLQQELATQNRPDDLQFLQFGEAAENDREQVKKASQRGEGVAEEEVTDNSRVKRGRTNTSIAINRGEAVMTTGFQTADSDAIMTPFPSNQNCWQGLPEGNFEFEAECGSHSPAIILEVTTISPENQLFTSSDKLPQDLSHEGSEISNLSDNASREFISARDNNSDFDDCEFTAESRLERPSVAGGFADFWQQQELATQNRPDDLQFLQFGEAAENDREQVKKASQRGEGVAEEEVTDNSRVKRGRTNTSIAINWGEAVMTTGFQTADSDAIMTPFPSNQNCWQGLPEGNFEFEAECGSHSPAIILEVTTISPENQLFTSSDKLPQDLSHEGSEVSNLSDNASREFISARDNNSDFDDCGLTAESRLERPSVAGGFADFWLQQELATQNRPDDLQFLQFGEEFVSTHASKVFC